MKVKFYFNQRIGTELPLVLVHGDEANSTLPIYLESNIPFSFFKHMGVAEHKFPFHSIEEIASLYVKELKEQLVGKSVILSGYSIGGLVSYEMAHQLELEGYEIPCVILLDSKAPRLGEKKEFHNRQIRWNEQVYMRILKKIYKKLIIQFFQSIHFQMPINVFFYYRMERYRKMSAKYYPPSIKGDLILIKSTKENYRDEYLGWQSFHSTPIQVHKVNGNHHEITTDPYIIEIAAIYNRIYRYIVQSKKHFNKNEYESNELIAI